MIGILKYIRGYVRIKIWGFAPERFLNLCSNKNILLWNIVKDHDVYYMNISLSGFRSLRSIARKTKTRVVILKRYGLPFLLPKIFSRKIFCLGLIAAVFFWFYTSFFVWEITIEGNQTITDDIFMDFLADQGIGIGVKSNKVDIEQLEKDIRREFDEITWTSAKFSGTNLIIAVKENDAVLSPVREEIISDLYADLDGTIISMIVRSGVPNVKIGDSIEMGTLLVSGNVPVYNDDGTIRNYQYTRADADIIVERTRDVYITLPYDYIKKVFTGRQKKQYSIHIAGKDFYFGQQADYTAFDEVSSENEISLMKGFTLPFSFCTHIYREYQNTECLYSLQEAEELLQKEYGKILEELSIKGVIVMDKNVTMNTSQGNWVLIGELKVREKTGTEIKR
ncbi:MAG TPA: sporulation protein YqfD [Lachnospiraceae bacterium]|nr:sporulation protein YqfD [Lachnospiraceae bacterium]